MNHTLRIGITDCGKFDNYRRWIASVLGVEVVKLSMNNQNAAEVETCDGVIFSGGEDLHPDLYGKPEYLQAYGLKEIIPERDQFEYRSPGMERHSWGLSRIFGKGHSYRHGELWRAGSYRRGAGIYSSYP